MTLTEAIHAILADARAAFADRWLSAAEARVLLTKGASMFVVAAAVLDLSGPEKREKVLKALSQVMAFLVPQLPWYLRLAFRLTPQLVEWWLELRAAYLLEVKAKVTA